MSKLIPSANCYSLIKHYEGCKLTAYQDTKSIWTIGFGNTYYENGNRVKQGDKITQIYANDLLPIIVNKFALAVNNLLKVNVTQHQFDALVSFAYNCGIGNLDKSTLLQKINRSQADSNEFLKWNRSGGKVLAGLTYRRQSEKHLFDTGMVKFFN